MGILKHETGQAHFCQSACALLESVTVRMINLPLAQPKSVEKEKGNYQNCSKTRATTLTLSKPFRILTATFK